MTPTIGRIVHYVIPETAGSRRQPKQKVFPAIICAVKEAKVYQAPDSEPKTESGSDVSLQIFGWADSSRESAWIDEVPFSPTPKEGHWSWPPKV